MGQQMSNEPSMIASITEIKIKVLVPCPHCQESTKSCKTCHGSKQLSTTIPLSQIVQLVVEVIGEVADKVVDEYLENEEEQAQE